jgi:hypothetical protein
MSFEAYLKHWLGNPTSINESKKSDDFLNLVEIASSGIGGELTDPISRSTSFGAIEQILNSLDPTILQKIKNNPDLQKVLLKMVSPGRVDWMGEYTTKSKKSMSALSSLKQKVDATIDFNSFTNLTLKQSKVKDKIYKMYLIFKYAASIPNLDKETNILSYLKDEGATIKISTEEDAPKYKIGRIGRIDNSIQTNEFEVIADEETKVIQKSELSTILELNPDEAELAKSATSDAYRKKIEKITKKLEDIIKKEVTDSLNYNSKVISELPDTPETMEKLQIDFKPLLDALGYSKFYTNQIKEKEKKIVSTERPSLRKKNRIKEKLMAALRLSLLPPLVNGEISQPGGDYFKLMIRLDNQNHAWMEASIKETLISPERISQFNNGPRKKESSLEEDQIAYLQISSKWIIKYIQSEVDGELAKRDLENSIATVTRIVKEKETEIKNYYLSKDFNMKNFKGIQLKPDLRLPLYQRVKLAVSEAERIAESPLKNLMKGLGQIAVGLLSTIPINIDQAVAKRNADQNRAVFNGLFSIIKGGVFAISKQGGRDFEEGTKKITNKLRLDAVGLTPYEKGEGPKFYKTADTAKAGANPSLAEDTSPGTSMQTPSSLPDQTMDTFSLAGPGKKTKSSKKPNIQKISNFKDFLKSKKS